MKFEVLIPVVKPDVLPGYYLQVLIKLDADRIQIPQIVLRDKVNAKGYNNLFKMRVVYMFFLRCNDQFNTKFVQCQ